MPGTAGGDSHGRPVPPRRPLPGPSGGKADGLPVQIGGDLPPTLSDGPSPERHELVRRRNANQGLEVSSDGLGALVIDPRTPWRARRPSHQAAGRSGRRAHRAPSRAWWTAVSGFPWPVPAGRRPAERIPRPPALLPTVQDEVRIAAGAGNGHLRLPHDLQLQGLLDQQHDHPQDSPVRFPPGQPHKRQTSSSSEKPFSDRQTSSEALTARCIWEVSLLGFDVAVKTARCHVLPNASPPLVTHIRTFSYCFPRRGKTCAPRFPAPGEASQGARWTPMP